MYKKIFVILSGKSKLLIYEWSKFLAHVELLPLATCHNEFIPILMNNLLVDYLNSENLYSQE